VEHDTLSFRAGEPDFSDIPKYENDWENTFYGKVHDVTPNYIPEPLGQHVKLSLYE